MEYNTQRPPLILPEYGRNIHKMVDYLKSIHDRELRNNMAKSLIDIMGNMNPHLRDVQDFKHKLWDHLAIMSDFELDIDWPYPLPDRKEKEQPPDSLIYSDPYFENKHYGKNLQNMLKKIDEYEDEETRSMLLEQLANHMKNAYVNWKKENVNDEVIFQDIKDITNGKIDIPEGLKLKEVKISSNKPKYSKKKPKKRRKKNSRY